MEPFRDKRLVKGRKGFLVDNPLEIWEGLGNV
jgi:hypothetical protein